MKRILVCFIILIIHPVCYARDPVSGYGTLIAVEFKANDKFTNAVGKLEYTGESIDIVSFTEGIAGIGIIALPQVYLILEKTIRLKGVHGTKKGTSYILFVKRKKQEKIKSLKTMS